MDTVSTTIAIASWDYASSVNEVKPLILRWTTLTGEIAEKLYLAREALRQIGGDRKREGQAAPTWTDYCNEIGITRKTANNWLESFVPRDQSPDGLPHVLAIESPDKFSKSKEDTRLEQIRRIAEFRLSGIRPEGWTDADEVEVRRQDAEKEVEKKAEELSRDWLQKYKPICRSKRDYFTEMLKNAREFKKYKLSSRPLQHMQSQAFDMVGSYLQSIPQLEDRARAALNLTYHLQRVINDAMEQVQQLAQQESGDAVIEMGDFGTQDDYDGDIA